MPSLNWFSAVTSYALESSIEVLIIFGVVNILIRVKSLSSPAAKSRFLLLPLIIPVVFSPALHLIFPWLERYAIIVQIENVLPILGKVGSNASFIAPLLIISFLLLLAYNLLTGCALSMREARNNSRTKPSVRVKEQKTLGRLARQFAVSKPLLTISTRHPKAAYIFGWKHPIVTLGSEWIRLLDAEEIEAVLAHELAHYKRGDNWQILIAKTCRDLMFFNPLAHWIYAEYNEALEQAADDLALQVTQKPLALASSLLKFWRMQQAMSAPIGSTGFAAHPNLLEKRIHRLCDYTISTGTNLPSDSLFFSLSIILTVALSIV